MHCNAFVIFLIMEIPQLSAALRFPACSTRFRCAVKCQFQLAYLYLIGPYGLMNIALCNRSFYRYKDSDFTNTPPYIEHKCKEHQSSRVVVLLGTATVKTQKQPDNCKLFF